MTDKQCVCLLNDSFPPLIDGVANTVVNYANVLTAHQHPVLVATPRYPGDNPETPYPVIRYHSIDTTRYVGYRTGYPFSMKTIDTIAKSDVGIIHSHCPFVSTVLARALREVTNKPIVFTYHTKFDVDIARALRNGLLEKAGIKVIVDNIQACDEVWVVSRGAGENLRTLGYEGDYRIMENGVDFPKARAEQSAVDLVTKELALPAGVPVFLFVGRIKWYKGLRIILDALSKLYAADMDFRMVFVGDGSDLPEVKDYAEKLGVATRCIYTGAVRDREKLRAYFSRADLFLFPSTYDTNGIVVREAAACGLGSVLIRDSCASEGITDGRNGILIDENADSLAAALLALRGNIEGMHAIGQHAQDDIYIAWEDSVMAAWDRYHVVEENYLARINAKGKTPFTEMGNEALFRMISYWYKAYHRLETARDELLGPITQYWDRGE